MSTDLQQNMNLMSFFDILPMGLSIQSFGVLCMEV